MKSRVQKKTKDSPTNQISGRWQWKTALFNGHRLALTESGRKTALVNNKWCCFSPSPLLCVSFCTGYWVLHPADHKASRLGRAQSGSLKSASNLVEIRLAQSRERERERETFYIPHWIYNSHFLANCFENNEFFTEYFYC